MELRAKAISIVQSSWAIGYALAALVTGIVLHYANWRMAFFVGILPALVTVWIRRDVPESEMWERKRAERNQAGTGLHSSAHDRTANDAFIRIFQPPFVNHTFALFFMNFFGMFAWWGLFTWMPPYLSLPVEQGGMAARCYMQRKGFGWVADQLGRRKSFLLYTFMAGVLVPLYAQAREPWVLLVLGAVVAFFGTGFFSGSGIIGSEIFPTAVRARALGFTYNGARALSSVAPFVIGRVGQTKGLSWAFYLCGASFLLACLVATQLPETKGKQLE